MASVTADSRFLARLAVEMMAPSKIGFSASHQPYCLENSSTYSQFRGNRFLASPEETELHYRRPARDPIPGRRHCADRLTLCTVGLSGLSAVVHWFAARDSRRARWRLMFFASALCPQLIPGLSVFHDGPDGVLDHLALSDLSSRLLLPLALCLRPPILSLALEVALTGAADHIPERFGVYLRDGVSAY